jgi:two-component system sensor histidine kinase KdpD
VQKIKPYLLSLGLIALMSLFGEGLHRYFAPTNLVMLYLLAVSVSASLWGRGPAAATAFISVVVFDYLFVPPQYSLNVHDTEYLLTFAGLLGVGLAISEFSARMRRNALAAQTLRESEKLHTALLNSISHDLRTPLVAITGSLSSLATNNEAYTAAEQKELIRLAWDKSRLLNIFVGELLDMSRIEAGSLQLKLRPCSVRELVAIAVGRVREQLGSRAIERRISADAGEVEVDEALMVKVITNLLDNAIKFSPAESPILIAAERSQQLVRITVADRGTGIPPHELPHVFDKFYQATRAEKIPGTGLGLAICKGIVEAHRGRIRLESEEGKGTRVIVELHDQVMEPAK